MQMKTLNVKRDIIHDVVREHNLESDIVDEALRSNIYTNKTDWTKFLNYLLFGLGIAFSFSGIIFFFAFNWDDLPKFCKMGMVEALIIACISCVLFTKLNLTIKYILLSGAALLVGALFAVFGQIYQTGADAYDFFLAWTVFIALWALVANFPPLWLIFMVLFNTTACLYSKQIAEWDSITLFNTLFLINVCFIIVYELYYRFRKKKNHSQWLLYLLTLIAVVSNIFGMFLVIFEPGYVVSFIWCIFFCIAGVIGGIVYGFISKSIFYIATVSAAAITIISFLMGKAVDDAIGVFFLMSIFIVASITGLVKLILTLNKEWNPIN